MAKRCFTVIDILSLIAYYTLWTLGEIHTKIGTYITESIKFTSQSVYSFTIHVCKAIISFWITNSADTIHLSLCYIRWKITSYYFTQSIAYYTYICVSYLVLFTCKLILLYANVSISVSQHITNLIVVFNHRTINASDLIDEFIQTMAGSTEETNNKTNGTVTVKYDGNLDELPEWRAGHTLDARKKRFGYTLDNLRNGTGDEQAQLSIASVLYKTLGPKLSAQYADLFNDESNMIVGTTLWNSITASDLNDKSLSSQVLALNRIFCDLMRDNMQGLGDFADAVSMAITRCRNSGILAFMKGTADTAAAEQLAKIKLLAAINLSAESTLVSELISKDLSYDVTW